MRHLEHSLRSFPNLHLTRLETVCVLQSLHKLLLPKTILKIMEYDTASNNENRFIILTWIETP
jgi:hypothetical protein